MIANLGRKLTVCLRRWIGGVGEGLSSCGFGTGSRTQNGLFFFFLSSHIKA